jgi:hypothetical protein
MVIVAVVALDCVATRSMSPNYFLPVVLGGFPMQIALVIGLLILFQRRRRETKSIPFLIGFEVVGWIGLAIYIAVCAQAPRSLDQHLGRTLSPVINAIGLRRFALNHVLRFGIAMAYLTMLQLIPALVAGWICQRWSKKAQPNQHHPLSDLPSPLGE